MLSASEGGDEGTKPSRTEGGTDGEYSSDGPPESPCSQCAVRSRADMYSRKACDEVVYSVMSF